MACIYIECFSIPSSGVVCESTFRFSGGNKKRRKSGKQDTNNMYVCKHCRKTMLAAANTNPVQKTKKSHTFQPATPKNSVKTSSHSREPFLVSRGIYALSHLYFVPFLSTLQKKKTCSLLSWSFTVSLYHMTCLHVPASLKTEVFHKTCLSPFVIIRFIILRWPHMPFIVWS